MGAVARQLERKPAVGERASLPRAPVRHDHRHPAAGRSAREQRRSPPGRPHARANGGRRRHRGIRGSGIDVGERRAELISTPRRARATSRPARRVRPRARAKLAPTHRRRARPAHSRRRATSGRPWSETDGAGTAVTSALHGVQDARQHQPSVARKGRNRRDRSRRARIGAIGNVVPDRHAAQTWIGQSPGTPDMRSRAIRAGAVDSGPSQARQRGSAVTWRVVASAREMRVRRASRRQSRRSAS